MFLLAVQKEGRRWLVQRDEGTAIFENVPDIHKFMATHPREPGGKYTIVALQATYAPVVLERKLRRSSRREI